MGGFSAEMDGPNKKKTNFWIFCLKNTAVASLATHWRQVGDRLATDLFLPQFFIRCRQVGDTLATHWRQVGDRIFGCFLGEENPDAACRQLLLVFHQAGEKK